MSRVIDMTQGKPAKLMLRFAFPVVLTNLGQQLYQIVDAVIVGRGVGVDALAAVGCTDWTYWLILWSMSAMTAGFATFVSRFFGEQDYRKMNRSILISAVLSAVIAVVLTVAGLLLARPLLVFLGTPKHILEDAVTYLSTLIAGTLIMTAYNLTASILRAFGDGKTPMVAMVISAVTNIALDLFFVMLLEWGVFGAALASVTSQLVAFLFCLTKLRTIEYVTFDKFARTWNLKQVGEILFFGLPLAMQYMVINLGGMILQSTINDQGSSFIAGYTAVNKLYGLLECTAIAMGNAFITFASQNYGARNYRRVRKGVNTAMVLAVGSSLLIMFLVLPLNRVLPLLFMDVTESGATDALDVASRYLINMTISMPILYLVYVHRNNLQAIGVSSWSFVSGVGEAVVRVVMAKVMFRWVGVNVLFFIEPFAWLAAWLFVMVPFYFYQRKRLAPDFAEKRIIEETERLLQEKDDIVIAIDGRCASGKTTLAAHLKEALSCEVIHMDDFFLRPEQRTKERLSVPGGNVDYERFLEEVIRPLVAHETFSYRPYDCHIQSMKEPILVPRNPVTIIEGSYSCHPKLWEYYDLHVFLDVDEVVQQERIYKRNGKCGAENFIRKWIPLEEAYFKAYGIKEKCEICEVHK